MRKNNKKDELYGFIVWEAWLGRALSSIHPKQFLFSIVSPGLSSSIGLLQQNYTCLNNYCLEDPDIDYYEEIA